MATNDPKIQYRPNDYQSDIQGPLSDLLDLVFVSTQGAVIFRGSDGWKSLDPGAVGNVLTSGGAGADVGWGAGGGGGGVISVTAGTGLAGGTITTTGTLSVATVGDQRIMSNISGGVAIPSGNTLTGIIDACIGNTQGDILYRSAAGWTVLPPGTSGYYLQTQGAGANPQWASSGAPGTVTSVATGAGLTGGPITTTGTVSLASIASNTLMANATAGSAAPGSTTVTAIIDAALGSTRGSILYRGVSAWVPLLPGTSGQVLQTLGSGADIQWTGGATGTVTSVATAGGIAGGPITTTGTISLSTILPNYVMSNLTAGSASPSGNSLTATIDAAIGSTQGNILYRGASAWSVLAPGTSGYYLQTQGAASNPQWAAGGSVTSVATGSGLTGGTITTTGTIAFASITDARVLANISGGAAAASANTLSAVIDKCIDNTQGDVLYRGAAGWAALAPGTNGQILTTGGPSADPSWTTVTGSGTVTSVATGSGLTGGPITTTGTVALASVANLSILANISGSSAAPSANTISAIIDAAIGTTQGDVLYRGASTWAVLAPGTTGQFLQTQGAAANPQWAAGNVGTVTSVATGTGLTGGTITSSGTIAIVAGGVGTTQLANSGVTYAKIQNASLRTLIGNPTASPAAPSEITLGAGLSFSGTTLVGQTGTVTSVTFTGDGTVLSSTPSSAVTTSGTLTAALATQANHAVLIGPTTGGPLAPTFRALVTGDLPTVAPAQGGTGLATLTAHAVLLGEGTSNVGFATIGTSGRLLIDQGAGADPTFNAVSGDIAITNAGVTSIGSNAVTTAKINNAAVTYAKVQNVAASSLLGNPTGSPAAPSEITLASGLTFSSTTLQTAITTLGDILYGSGSNTATRLAGNTAATKKFLEQTGTGSVSAAPAWGTIAAADLPTTGLTITQHAGAISTGSIVTGTATFDLSTSDSFTLTLDHTQTVTLAVSNPTVGQKFALILVQDSTGSCAVTWFSGIVWPGAVVPTLTTTASKKDVFVFWCISSGVYLGAAYGQNF